MRIKNSGTLAALVLCAVAVSWATRAVADEYPFVYGDFWEVTEVKLKDSGGLAYSNFIAGEWRDNQEFAKSKGWINGYRIFQNLYPRPGEPDIYLVTIRPFLESGPETEKRDAEFMDWKKKTIAQMDKETGDRAEFREVIGSTLLQELVLKK